MKQRPPELPPHKSGEVENVEVLFFSTRLLRDNAFEVPVIFEKAHEKHRDTMNAL